MRSTPNLIALFAALAILPACATDPSEPRAATGTTADQTATNLTPQPQQQQPEPIIAGNASGLEVHWWLADDSSGAVASALAPYASSPQPTDPQLRERWESSGFRLIKVPLDQWTTIEPTFIALHQRTRDWVGWTTQWREVFRGRRVGGDQPLIIEAQRSETPRSILRVLLRCWPAPPPDTAVRRADIRVEIAFQLLPVADPKARDPFAKPTLIPVQDEGSILRRLILKGALEPGYAYILTAEAPGITWKVAKDPLTAPPQDQPEATSTDALEAFISGPPSASLRTLREAALAAAATETKNRAAKAIIVFIPRPPADFRLLP